MIASVVVRSFIVAVTQEVGPLFCLFSVMLLLTVVTVGVAIVTASVVGTSS